MNVTRTPLIVLVALAGLSVAADASAQAAWDVPAFLPPQPGEDIGIYITTQGDFGLAGIWRQQGNLNLGLRLGYIDAADGSIVVGAETWGGIVDAGAEFPLDVTWTAGVGAAFDGGTLFGVPVGLSIGRTFMMGTLPVQVYGHPRLALTVISVDDDTESDLDGLLDLGGEIRLNEDWKARFAVTFADGDDAVGIGLAYRFGRGVAVR